MRKVALLVPPEGYREDWQTQADRIAIRLVEQGLEVEQRCWQDAPDSLARFDLILPLFAWGYQRTPEVWEEQLGAWEALGLPFANPVATLRWNGDKRYLAELEAKDIAIVPTQWSEAFCEADLAAARAAFGENELVVKPPVSAGADGTYRLASDSAFPEERRGQPMMIQPMMHAIVEEGEYSLFLFDGAFSHAVIKRPTSGDFRVQEQFGGTDAGIAPDPPAIALAKSALAALDPPPLYARFDMVRDDAGAMRLMELELIEPSLFLHLATDKGTAFAEAVAARIV